MARCTVERLMKAEALCGIRREKTRKTTLGEGAETERPADLADRQFVADAPNQLWVADLTYVRTHAGWVYVAFILDVFSRMVTGWQVSTLLRTDLALDMGLWSRKRAGQDVAGLTNHSDRGVQYRAIRYTERLAEADAVASVGSKGDSYDNAMAEAFNSLFKAECIRNPVMRPPRRLEVRRRRRDRCRRVRRLVQPQARPRRDRARSAGRVRGQLLGQHHARALPCNARPRRGRIQVTEPPRNPGRFNPGPGSGLATATPWPPSRPRARRQHRAR